ncbi:HNH endonuclease [Leptospira sp. 'Mane']|uniref:HNH endonuclease n=1 Tax=Leptospira sp. 'Mane' TaxID=3387407 RepID=UPI00398B6FFD
MQKCINCNINLSNITNSEEHILPHSIGWKTAVTGIFCKECNEKFGKSIDHAMFENFRFPATVLNVYRENDRNIPGMRLYSKTSSDYIWLLPGGSIKRASPIQKISDNIWRLYAETKEQLNKLVNSFIKKKSDVKIEEIENDQSILAPEDYHTTEIKWFTGNSDVLKSLIKSAMVFYLQKENIPQFIEKIPALLAGINAGGKAYPIVFKQLNPEPITAHSVYHTIYLIGSLQNKMLASIIELFSTYRYFILLNNNYPGLDLCVSHSQNCITGQEYTLTKTYRIEDFRNDVNLSIEERSMGFQKEIRPLKKLLNNIILNKLLNKKLDFELFDIPKGTEITQEIIDKIDAAQDFTRSENRSFDTLNRGSV